MNKEQEKECKHSFRQVPTDEGDFMINCEKCGLIEEITQEDQTINRIREVYRTGDLKDWENLIAELLKSQRDEERLRSAKIVEELMEDSEHWQPIASRIMDRVIIGKEDLSLIKNN